VVLLLGPLYHLLSEEARRTALHESWRILRPGGLMFAAFIIRYAPIRDTAKYDPAWILEHRDVMERILTTDAHASRSEGGFTDAFFAHPSEIRPLLHTAGFEMIDLVAGEGVVSLIDDQINDLRGELREAWVDLNYRLGKDPDVHGAAEHLLAVSRST
jgi:S-adenosylmethionine-dependent methyltransferase